MSIGLKYNGAVNKISENAYSDDLVKAILAQVPAATRQMNSGAALQFARYTPKGKICPRKTAEAVWLWLRNNITYKKDEPNAQRLFLPSAFTTLKTGDCKSYALFTAAVLSSLKIKNGLFFTSYKSFDKPSHVYNYIETVTGKTVPVDGCYSSFGKMKKPLYIRKIKVL